MAQVEAGSGGRVSHFGRGIREPFPSVSDCRAPRAVLEHAPGAAWLGGRARPWQGTVEAGAKGAGKTFTSGIALQLCRLRYSYGLCHPV